MGVVDLRALRIVSILAALTLPVAVLDRHWSAVVILFVVAGVAWLPSLSGHRPESWRRDDNAVGLMAEVAMSWVQVMLAAWVVTWLLAFVEPTSITLTDPLSALFEAASGLTTTGLSMVSAPEELSATLQWWRSVLQWGGAVGVVVFALFVAERSGDRDDYLGTEWGDHPSDDPARAARIIVGILAALTVVCGFGLWISGDPPWVALNHAMTAASTGGFSVDSDSAGDSPIAAQFVLVMTMLVSAISFATLWGAVSRQGPPLWKRTQLRWSLLLLVGLAGSAVLAAADAGVGLGGVLFNAVSASTTAGFSAGDAHRQVPTIALVTMVSMLIGGAAGSTAGGLKAARVAWLAKATRRWLPQGGEVYGKSFHWDGEEIDPDEAAERITGAGALAAIWVLTVLAATYVLALAANVSVLDAGFESVSALSGVGLSRGVTDADLPGLAKGSLATAMLVGRVEITAFVALGYYAMSPARRAAAHW